MLLTILAFLKTVSVIGTAAIGVCPALLPLTNVSLRFIKGVLFGVTTGRLSGVLPGVFGGVLFGVTTGRLSGVLPGVFGVVTIS